MKPKVEALLQQIISGNFKNTNVRVLHYVKQNGMSTIDDLRQDLNIAHQTLTSAVSHLEDLGVLYKMGVTRTKGISYSIYTYEANPIEMDRRAKEKKVEKFIAWKKRGLKEFADLIEEEKDNATLPFPNPNTSRQLGFFTD